MLGDLPDYNSRIKKRIFLFAILIVVGLALVLIQRQGRAKVRPSAELKTGVKILTDPDSVVKDL